MSERRSFLGSAFHALDVTRRLALDLLFLGVLALLVVAAWTARPKVPSGAALVIRPQGVIVEQLSGADPLQRLAAERAGVGQVARETLLRDLLDGVRLAKADGRIRAIFLDLDSMAGAGMTKLRDLGAALADFRRSGKKVIAYADAYAQGPYYLAAQADEVYLHPQGMVFLEGFGRWRSYYKEGLDRLGVTVHVFRVGEYKSAVEPYLRNDMSPEAKEMSLDAYGDLWRDYLGDVAGARKVQPADVQSLIDSLPDRLRATGGDMARLARDARLVDTLGPRDAARQRMIALVGAQDDGKTFRQVALPRRSGSSTSWAGSTRRSSPPRGAPGSPRASASSTSSLSAAFASGSRRCSSPGPRASSPRPMRRRASPPSTGRCAG